MLYLQILVLTIVSCITITGCSNYSSKQQTLQVELEQIEQGESINDIRVLDEVPQHIQAVKNLTTFPGDSKPKYSIKLTPIQIYGEIGEPYLTKIQTSSVDDKGRIIILDIDSSYEQSLYVFNADGTYHAQIGRQGRGPGEYIYVFDVQTQAEKIIVRDVTNQRLNIYNSIDYSFERMLLIKQLAIREHEKVKGLNVGTIEVRNDGNFLIGFYQSISNTGWPIHKYLLMDKEGNALSYKPVEFRSSFKANGKTRSEIIPSYMPMPFMGSTVEGMSDEGELYTAWSHDFLIRKYDAQGMYQSAIYYPLKGTEFDIGFHIQNPFFDESDVMKALDIHDEKLPDSNPIIDRLIVDDEKNIWVSLPIWGNDKQFEWWVLAESGELLAKLVLPKDRPIYDIKNGFLYSKELNEETGSEYVVKYRIELTEKELVE